MASRPRYTEAAGDHVSAQGNGLMLHAGEQAGARTVHLPLAARVRDDGGASVCSEPCRSFAADRGAQNRFSKTKRNASIHF